MTAMFGPKAGVGIKIGAAALFLALAAGSAAAGPTPVTVAMPSPLTPAGATELGTLRVSLDAAAYAQLRTADTVVLTDFALDGERRADLELHRFDVFAEDAQIVVVGPAGAVKTLEKPDVVLLAGQVAGDSSSVVYLALSPQACQGHIQTGGETYILSAGPFAAQQAAQIYRVGAMDPRTLRISDHPCEEARVIPGHDRVIVADEAGAPSSPLRALSCRESYIAIETDHELLASLFGGHEMAATMYVASLMGAVSEIHQRELNNRLRISYLRLWATSNDPWTKPSTGEQLDEFRAYWNQQMTGVPRTAAHFLSGRGLGGGVAYVGAVCYPEYDYGLSANLEGYFPLPMVDHHAQNWDPFVTAHELGHNFGTFHTHDGYNPVIDGCGLGDCSQAWGGTLMSYCHTCSGGMTNIRLTYHPRVIDRILTFLDTESVCNLLLGPPTITDHPDRVAACPGVLVELSAAATGGATLAYQWRKNGEPIPGATASTCTVNVAHGTAGVYDVVVSNACASATSQAARIVVRTADLDGDGVADFTDYLEFLNRFDAQDERVDFTADGVVDFADYLEFLNVFGGTCS